GIAEVLARIAADHHAAALHHEPREGSGITADDDGAALHVDAGPRADGSLADKIAAAQCGAEGGTGVLLDNHRAGQHVLGAGPADPPGNPHVRPVDEPDAEVPERTIDDEVQAVQDADADGMLGTGIANDDGAVAIPHELADPQVDLSLRHVRCVDLGALVEIDVERIRVAETVGFRGIEEHLLRAAAKLLGVHPHLVGDVLVRSHLCHTFTSSSYGSQVSISCGSTERIATSSEARATRSSAS